MKVSSVVAVIGVLLIGVGFMAPSLLPLSIVGGVGSMTEIWVASNGQVNMAGPPGAPAPTFTSSGTMYIAVYESPGQSVNITMISLSYCGFTPASGYTNTGGNTCTPNTSLVVSQTGVSCPPKTIYPIGSAVPVCYGASVSGLTSGQVYIFQAVLTYITIGSTTSNPPLVLNGYFGYSGTLYQPGPSPPPPSYVYPSLLVQVNSEQTAKPVAGATVYVEPAGLSGTTDSQGQVLFKQIQQTGTETVTVEGPSGYLTASKSVVLSWNTQAYLLVILPSSGVPPNGYQCPSGEWYNITANACQSLQPPVQPPPVSVSCPSGELYNLTSQMCVPPPSTPPPHPPVTSGMIPPNYTDIGLGVAMLAMAVVLRRRER